MSLWARALTLLLLSTPASAQGLLQLTLSGQIEREGGSFVEIEIAAMVVDEPRLVEFQVHLGEGTTSSDVVQLVSAQLERAGMDVTAPAASQLPAESARLFVHRANFCNLRLGGGLEGAITLCDRQPKSLRILPPQATALPATLTVIATTQHPHTKARHRERIEIELPADASSGRAAELLVLGSIEAGWVADRPRLDVWQPVKLGSGTFVVGCNIKLGDRESDWRLEVEIEEESSVVR